MRISDWSSDVCSSDLADIGAAVRAIDDARRAQQLARMRADRGEAFARRQPRGDDILDHHDARAGGNLEAAAQAELPLLAFDEHPVAAERPRGIIAGSDAADTRRDDAKTRRAS